MNIKTVNIYQFNELSDEAKDKARAWWRGCYTFDSECTIDDACGIAELMGLDIRCLRKHRADGSVAGAPSVYWSGFWNQGDGASFDGTYAYRKGSVAAVKAYAPQDTELHRIAKVLADTQRKAFYQLAADIKQYGRHYHERTMEIQVYYRNDVYRTIPEGYEEPVIEALRDFAGWIYKQLQREYEYQTADEQVDEAIIANEYEFDEEGNRV